MKAVFDTNVLLAAFITEGICSKILVRGRKRQFHLILCPVILREFERVLIKKFSITRNEARSILQIVSEAMHSVVSPSQSVQGICRDPDDDSILACALEAGADYLVTGDVDLLELKIFKGIRIVTPREFELLFND
ncbi:MAG: putative toxin-antitoxin system toxin component, PIN family [Deltaproteobacteria bacterium]|jgi:putative PIN family toxin of toxin-antitoxin system|nr:putative toxin-antitoxin system toxin component, PIN family [Deltaproteobacteria bacterium]